MRDFTGPEAISCVVFAGLALMMIGSAFVSAGIAIGAAKEKRKKRFAAAAATATVTDVRKAGAGPRGWRLAYEFATANGGLASATSGIRVGCEKGMALVGEKRIVLYDPKDPSAVYVPEEWASARVVSASFVAVGWTLFALGFAAVTCCAAAAFVFGPA